MNPDTASETEACVCWGGHCVVHDGHCCFRTGGGFDPETGESCDCCGPKTITVELVGGDNN